MLLVLFNLMSNGTMGLHQFLQIKHGLSLTNESLSSILVSTFSYLQKYQTIIGVTGSLGDSNCQQFYKDSYSIQHTMIIPPSFPTKCTMYPPMICNTTQHDHYQTIVASALTETTLVVVC
jgi:hypothetical protein